MSRNYLWCCVLTLLLASRAQAEVAVWPAPAESQIEKLDPRINVASRIWTPGENTIRLSGAGGEHVYFQIVISCDSDTLREVTLNWSGLAGPKSSIGKVNITAYLAALVKVYAPSTEAGRAGWYPDPLAPLSGAVDIRPDRWESHKNQTFWVEIAIPRKTPGGRYEGEIFVSSGRGQLASYRLNLTVRGFSLPEAPHLFSLFNCSKGWMAAYYDSTRLAGRSLDDILVQYFDFMLDRGIQPWINPLLQPQYSEKDGRLALTWPNEKWEKHFLTRPAYQRVTFPAEPRGLERMEEGEPLSPVMEQKVRDWVGGICEHYSRNGWLDKLSFFGPVDEPNTLAEYQELIRWGELVRSVNKQVSYQVTEQPLPEEKGWPSLGQVADDWVVHGSALEGNRAELTRLIGLGQHACWYISCDQTYPMANYFIDAHGAEPRAVAWITYSYGLQGILYWAVNFWPEVRSPWRDPVTWKRSECNAPLAGEGSLLYPGEEIRAYCRLNDVSGPVSSIRFEQLRKGLQDVEYLYLLESKGHKEEARKLCGELVSSAELFSRDPARYEEIKEEAAKMIESSR